MSIDHVIVRSNERSVLHDFAAPNLLNVRVGIGVDQQLCSGKHVFPRDGAGGVVQCHGERPPKRNGG